MTKQLLDTHALKTRLEQKNQEAGKILEVHHPETVKLLAETGFNPALIREQATKLLTAGALAGTLILTSPQLTTSTAHKQTITAPRDLSKWLSEQIKKVLPDQVQPLSNEQEEKISSIISDTLGIGAHAELNGNRLNHSFGLIGAEQHLPRYPGDTVEQHGQYLGSGITPGLGAWGYFAESRNELTSDLENKEKYYVAVQTLYLKDWTQRLTYLRDWYKHRKVILINPVNGKAVVAVVADAGPADWTGKHFGGSPEVMAELELNTGMQKGPVILFFVDDGNDKVALGPISKQVTNYLSQK